MDSAKPAKENRNQIGSRSAFVVTAPGLDAQFAELMETVWACEHGWNIERRIDAVIRYAAR